MLTRAKMISNFLKKCFCLQRNLYSMSKQSIKYTTCCHTRCLYSRTLVPVIAYRHGAVGGTSPSRTVYLAADRLSRLGVGGDQHHHYTDDPDLDDRMREKFSKLNLGWNVRLANENGYLSWCRNTYLVTMVGIAMQAEGTFAMSQQAAEVAFLLAGMNLFWGTCSFASNIILLRRHIQMSLPIAIIHLVGVFVHLLLWMCTVLMYVGFSEENHKAISSTESSAKSSQKRD